MARTARKTNDDAADHGGEGPPSMADRLRAYMIKRQLTLSEAAREIGIDRGTLSIFLEGQATFAEQQDVIQKLMQTPEFRRTD